MKNRYLIYFIIAGLILGSFFSALRANALTFGSTDTSGNDYPLDYIVSAYYQMGNINGIGDSVSAYIHNYESGTVYITYRLADSTGAWVTNGQTTETTISGGTTEWVTGSFSIKPSLTANAYYYICIKAISDCEDPNQYSPCVLYLTTGASNIKTKNLQVCGDPSFPSSWTSLVTIDASATMRIYVTYHSSNPEPPSNLLVSKVFGSNSSLYVSWTKALSSDYTRVQYKTGSNPVSISDGTNAYNNTGSSFTLNSLIETQTYYFSAWSYNSTNKLWSLTYVSDNEQPYVRPSLPTSFLVAWDYYDYGGYRNILTWSNTNPIKSHIRWNNSAFPNTILSGTFLINTTNYATTHVRNSELWSYYYSLWTYDSTAGLYSSSYLTSLCYNISGGSTSLTVINNTLHTTGKYETLYSTSTGWKIWLNFTGAIPTINKYQNINNATGNHNSNFNSISWLYNVYANYTGNTTGCPSCNSTNLILYENIINATGIHQSLYNPITGWKVWSNYTGNITVGNCSGIYWLNYTDGNVTMNISFNKQSNSYTSDYAVNEESWLYIASALLLDNSQFFIIILLSLWLFFVSKYLEYKDVTVAYVVFGLSIPLSLIIAVISLSFAFGYIIVFLIPIVSLILLADSYFSKRKKR